MLDRYSSISISLERGWEQPTVCHHVRATWRRGTGAGAPVEAVAYLEPVPGARIAAELGASCGDTNTYVPFRIPITVARDRPAHLLNRVNGW